jgi:hypothetical protein
MRKIVSVLMIMVLSFTLTSCASIVGQSVFPVTINSNPSDAKVSITDERGVDIYAGRTPTTVTLAAGESYFHAKVYNLTFSKEGYAQQHAQIRATLSGWYFGNILFGGLIGLLIVDPLTGKMWKINTNTPTFANLSEQTASNNKTPSLQIATLDQIPEDMRKNLVQIN